MVGRLLVERNLRSFLRGELRSFLRGHLRLRELLRQRLELRLLRLEQFGLGIELRTLLRDGGAQGLDLLLQRGIVGEGRRAMARPKSATAIAARRLFERIIS